MQVNRRDFIKAVGIGAGAVAGLSVSQPALAASNSGNSQGKAMLYDSSKCVGCRACQTACKEWNNMPAESTGYDGIYDNPRSLSAETWTLIKARDITVQGEKDVLLCKYQCMHCTEAACVKVCPTHALHYHPLGFVAYDKDICSGCGYCTEFCPFQVPHLEGSTLTGLQKAQKCTFCQDRVPDGRPTACAEACPAGAILFGDRQELIAEGQKRVESMKSRYPKSTLYGANELGGLHVLYVLKESPSIYQFPEYPEFPPVATAWQDIIQPLGCAVGGLTILGLGLNYVIAREAKHLHELPGGKEK